MRAHVDILEQLGCEVTKLGLKQPAILPFEKWEAVGRELNKRVKRTDWCFADWWAFGGHRYGEKTALVDAADWEGPAYKTLANAAVAARAFEPSRRRELLSLRHHIEVAHLPPHQADELLDWAQTPTETGKIQSVWDLKAEIQRRDRPVTVAPAKTVALTILPEPDETSKYVALSLSISPAPEPKTREYALKILPEPETKEYAVTRLVPRFEPEQPPAGLAEPVDQDDPSDDEEQSRIIRQALALLRHAEMYLDGATPETLLEVAGHLQQFLARLTKRAAQQSGDDHGNGNVVSFR